MKIVSMTGLTMNVSVKGEVPLEKLENYCSSIISELNLVLETAGIQCHITTEEVSEEDIEVWDEDGRVLFSSTR